MARGLWLLPIDKYELATPELREMRAAMLAVQFYKKHPRPKDLRRLMIRGDSMEHALVGGDQIIVDSGVQAAQDDIVAVNIAGHNLVKRMHVCHVGCPCSKSIPPIHTHRSLGKFRCKGDGLLLVPDNPKYMATKLSQVGPFTMVGVAIAVIKVVDELCKF